MQNIPSHIPNPFVRPPRLWRVLDFEWQTLIHICDSAAIEITDSEGNRVRSYSSEEGDFERCTIANMDQRLPFGGFSPVLDYGTSTGSAETAESKS